MDDLKTKFPKIFSFFEDNEFAATTFINKYALKDKDGNILEDDPNKTILRVMTCLADNMPTEYPTDEWLQKNNNNIKETWKEIFIKGAGKLNRVVPQGSILSAIGNNEFLQSLSNCFVVDSPHDSISGILKTAEEIASITRRRGGVGIDLSTLRPHGAFVANAARNSTGVYGFMNFYSDVCRTMCQCLHFSTKILTNTGIKQISDVEVGDQVWTENGWTKVLNKLKSTSKTFIINTYYGHELICSDEHVVHTINGEKKIADLVVGDPITKIIGDGWNGNKLNNLDLIYTKKGNNQSNRLKNINIPHELTEDISYLIGNSYGDGYVDLHSKSKIICGLSISLSLDYPQIKEKLISILQKNFGITPSVKPGCGKCEILQITSRSFIEYLNQNKFLKQKAHSLKFPQQLYGVPSNIVMSFIAGFFDADGSVVVGKKSIKMVSISKDFMQDIHTILTAHGIVCRLTRTKRNKKTWNDIYTITISGQKSQELLKKYLYQSIKITKKYVWSKQKDFARTIYKTDYFNTKASKHKYIIDNNQLLTYSTVDRLKKDLKNTNNVFLLCDKIISKEPYEDQSITYDLVLEHTNLFFASGLYVHNSGRRGALIITLDIKHPDAELLTTAKQDLKYCTGANVSLKISDKFMKAVTSDKDFIQQFPIESDAPTIKKKINAKDLWKTICKCAWSTGEPGLLFFDHIKDNLPADKYNLFKTHGINPCAELPLSKNDSCRLAAICLPYYVENKFQNDCYFNFEKFVTDVRIGMRLMDAVVTAELKQINLILQKLEIEKQQLSDDNKTLYDTEISLWNKIKNSGEQGRRTGLGLYGLADCLAQLRLRYDSNEALDTINNIFKCFRDIAYNESIEMAKEYGPFPAFNWDTEKECDFIKRLPADIKEGIQKYGRRNISLLTCSPTGTLSIIAQCSSGIEPSFRLMYLRRRKVNPNDIEAKVDFTDEVGDKWSHHQQFEKNIQRYFEIMGKEIPLDVKTDDELMRHLPKYFITSEKIRWKRKVEILSIMGNYIDHSISNTLNIPSDTKPELIEEIYQLAWEKGVKGITIYRDGSRSGVLLSNESQEKQKELETIQRADAPKRPVKLPCDVYVTSTNKTEYVVIVGLLNNSIYEIFCGEYNNEIPKKPFNGFVEKKGKGKYILNYIDSVEIKQIDINEYFDNKEHATVTRLISMSLRHGTPLEYIIQQLQRSSSNMFEFGPSLSRILKKYVKIEDLKNIYNSCSNCGSKDVILTMESGCYTLKCNSCNTVDSKCN